MLIALGSDASVFHLDGPLPEIPEGNASKSGRERVIERARRDNLTVRQLAQIAGSYGGLAMVGTPRNDCRPDGGVALQRSLRRVQHHVPVGAGRPRRFRSTGSSPNCSAATSSAANTKAGPCAKTSASPPRKPLFPKPRVLKLKATATPYAPRD
jgi:hypothetical protein